jgi:hypothetical protein
MGSKFTTRPVLAARLCFICATAPVTGVNSRDKQKGGPEARLKGIFYFD